MTDHDRVAVRPQNRTERSLPEFLFLRDTELVLRTLRETDGMCPPGVRWDRCVLESMRNRTYEERTKRAKSSTLITYRLSDGSSSMETSITHVYLRAFIEPRHDSCPEDSVWIPELRGYAWRFPDDPHIPALSTIARGDSTRAVKMLRYKPADRCTLRIRKSTTASDQNGLIAKAFSSTERATAVYERALHMWNESKRSSGAFNVPEPVLFDRSRALLWMTELSGTSPRRADLDTGRASSIALALAALHSSAAGNLSHRGHGAQVAEVAMKSRNLATLIPSTEGVLAQVERRLRETCPKDSRTSTTHGAFRLRQLLLLEGEVGIVDFDSMAMGDPLEDVADMVLDIDPFFSVGSATNSLAADAFLRAYAEQTGPLDGRLLAWHLPMQLIKRAHWLRSSARVNPSTHSELLARIDLAGRAAVIAAGPR